MRSLTLTALITLAGCVTSPVVPLDNGDYLISMHTGFSLMGRDTLIEKSAIEAQAFCAKRETTKSKGAPWRPYQ